MSFVSSSPYAGASVDLKGKKDRKKEEERGRKRKKEE